MKAEDFKDIAVGTNIHFVYRPRSAPVHLSGRYLGLKGGMVSIRVYRTVNYGKEITHNDLGRKVITDYDPGQDDPSTYNDQTLDPGKIEAIMNFNNQNR